MKNNMQAHITKIKKSLGIIKIERVLVVIDMEKGFMIKGSLASHELMSITPEVKRLILEEFNKPTDEIIFALDSHTKNAAEYVRFNNSEHCLENTEESEIIDELKEFTKNRKVFKKNSTMIYALNQYRKYLTKNSKIKEMVFVGVLKDMCVFDAAYPTKKHFEQENRVVEIVVPQNATATYSWPGHDKEEISNITDRMLNQVGILTPKVYTLKKEGNNYGK